jgi:hypothetical protein
MELFFIILLQLERNFNRVQEIEVELDEKQMEKKTSLNKMGNIN